MSSHLTPVEVCLRLIGPLPMLEVAVGYKPKAGYLWMAASKNRDAGDFPTTRLMRRLLAHAARHHIPLTADHLIWGASAEDIEALLAVRALTPAEIADRLRQEAAE